jgi:hypothetical protein
MPRGPKLMGGTLDSRGRRRYRYRLQIGKRRRAQSFKAATEEQAIHSSFGPLLDAPMGDPLRYEGHARKARLVFDVVGVGGGPHDTLKNRCFPVQGFNGGEKPIGPNAGRFFNRRAEAAWQLRELLEAGHAWNQRRLAGEPPGRSVGLALPPGDRDQLIRELCAIEWTTTGDRKIQLESKATIGPKLGKGQSPDYFDALCMALANDGIRSFATVPGAEQICF